VECKAGRKIYDQCFQMPQLMVHSGYGHQKEDQESAGKEKESCKEKNWRRKPQSIKQQGNRQR